MPCASEQHGAAAGVGWLLACASCRGRQWSCKFGSQRFWPQKLWPQKLWPEKLWPEKLWSNPRHAYSTGRGTAHAQLDPRFLLGAPRDRGAARGCCFAGKAQRGCDQQLERVAVVGCGAVANLRVQRALVLRIGLRRQHRKRQGQPHPAFQTHPHQHHRQQHHVGGAAPDPLQVDRVARLRHRAGHRQVECKQYRCGPRGCAPVPANAGLDQQQHGEGHERTGKVARWRLGVVDRADEHRDVDPMRGPGQPVVPPPAVPRDCDQHHRPGEKTRQQRYAQHVEAYRLNRIEPQCDQEHQCDQRAAGGFDFARISGNRKRTCRVAHEPTIDPPRRHVKRCGAISKTNCKQSHWKNS